MQYRVDYLMQGGYLYLAFFVVAVIDFVGCSQPEFTFNYFSIINKGACSFERNQPPVQRPCRPEIWARGWQTA